MEMKFQIGSRKVWGDNSWLLMAGLSLVASLCPQAQGWCWGALPCWDPKNPQGILGGSASSGTAGLRWKKRFILKRPLFLLSRFFSCKDAPFLSKPTETFLIPNILWQGSPRVCSCWSCTSFHFQSAKWYHQLFFGKDSNFPIHLPRR